MVSRGDPLTPHLHAALADRYPLVADIGVELSGARRALVAGTTLRPKRHDWAENYMKSSLGFDLRSRLARAGLAAIPGGFDVAVQTHALFTTHTPGTMIYVDCTYRQAMLGWPEWAPRRGRALTGWLATETEMYQRAAHLFTFTDQGRDSLTGFYQVAPDRVTVVGAGVNFEDISPPRTDTSAHPVVLFVGKDFTRKGGDVLLRAFVEVRRQVPGARLQIVGTQLPGSTPDGVDVLGLITDRAQLSELYTKADVFCLPSRFDPGGIVVLEAMAHGLPCVLSRSASHLVPELVDDPDAGWVADTGDAQSLAEGLIAYLSDPELARQVGARSRYAVETRHLWKHVVDRMAPAIDASVG